MANDESIESGKALFVAMILVGGVAVGLITELSLQGYFGMGLMVISLFALCGVANQVLKLRPALTFTLPLTCFLWFFYWVYFKQSLMVGYFYLLGALVLLDLIGWLSSSSPSKDMSR